MQKRTIGKKIHNYNVRLDKTDWNKLQAIKKEHNLSVVFRNALDDFYQEHIVKDKT